MTHHTAILVDLVGYSDIQRALEQSLGVSAARDFDAQIQSFVEAALTQVGGNANDNILTRTGDGALLKLNAPDSALDFAARLHGVAAAHNKTVTEALAKRVFRIGIATGELEFSAKTGAPSGMVISRAARLEAKANPGGVLIDAPSYEGASPGLQAAYCGPEIVKGKRAESFAGWRSRVDSKSAADEADFETRRGSQSNGTATRVLSKVEKSGAVPPTHSPDADWNEALRRIEVELSTCTGALDFSGLDIPSLPSTISQIRWLTKLKFWRTSVRDLSPIRDLTQIQILDISNTKVKSLDEISNLTELRELDCSFTFVYDLKPLFKMHNLEYIEFKDSSLTNIDPLTNLSNLRKINISYNKICDISPLHQLEYLYYIDMSENLISCIDSIKFCKKMEYLDISYTDVRDLDPISDFRKLHTLICSNTKIDDISALSNMRSLIYLDCDNLNITKYHRNIWSLPQLRRVDFSQSSLGNVPSSILGRDSLSRIRRYFETENPLI